MGRATFSGYIVPACEDVPGRLGDPVRGFVGGDFVRVAQRQADLVPAVQEAFLEEGVQIEAELLSVRTRDGLRGQRSEERRVGKECRL